MHLYGHAHFSNIHFSAVHTAPSSLTAILPFLKPYSLMPFIVHSSLSFWGRGELSVDSKPSLQALGKLLHCPHPLHYCPSSMFVGGCICSCVLISSLRWYARLCFYFPGVFWLFHSFLVPWSCDQNATSRLGISMSNLH